METRTCEYCRTEVGHDTVVCPRCKRDIPFRVEKRTCPKHAAQFDVRHNIRTGKTYGDCRRCMEEERESLRRAARQRNISLAFRGLSLVCIGAIAYNLFCMKGL